MRQRKGIESSGWGHVWTFQQDDQGRSNERWHLNNPRGTWESKSVDVWGRSVLEGTKSRCKGRGTGCVCETTGRPVTPERTKWGANSRRWGQKALGAFIWLSFWVWQEPNGKLKLSGDMLPQDPQMSFWLLCGAQSWKGWGKNKESIQGPCNNPEEGQWWLTKDQSCGGGERWSDSGCILKVHQKDYQIVWTWGYGVWSHQGWLQGFFQPLQRWRHHLLIRKTMEGTDLQEVRSPSLNIFEKSHRWLGIGV